MPGSNSSQSSHPRSSTRALGNCLNKTICHHLFLTRNWIACCREVIRFLMTPEHMDEFLLFNIASEILRPCTRCIPPCLSNLDTHIATPHQKRKWHSSKHKKQQAKGLQLLSYLWHELPASWYITCLKIFMWSSFCLVYIITHIHEGNDNPKPCWTMRVLLGHMGVSKAAHCRIQLPRSSQSWKAAMGLGQLEHAPDCMSRARRYN